MADQTADVQRSLDEIKTEMKRLGNEMNKFAKYLAKPDDKYIFCVDPATIKVDIVVGVRDERPTTPLARLTKEEIEWEGLCKLLRDYEAIVSRTRNK